MAAHYFSHRSGEIKGITFHDNLTPTEFKDQLWRSFQIRLSGAELGALCAFFDKDGDGTISGAEFQLAFFRAGREVRARLTAQKVDANAARVAKRDAKAAAAGARYNPRVEAPIIYPPSVARKSFDPMVAKRFVVVMWRMTISSLHDEE